MLPFSKHHAVLSANIVLFFITIAYANDDPCPSFCRYRFCASLLRDGNQIQDEDRVFSMGFPNEPLGPFPCIQRKTGFVQTLLNVTGGEARVAKEFSGDKFIPISKYMREEISPSFSKRFFRWVRNPETRQSAIQHKRPEGNHARYLEQLCVRMPIASFLRRNEDGSMTRVRTRGKKACVGFRPTTTRVNVKFEWSSSNDFDLRLREPNGFEINRFGPNTQSPNGGRLKRDNGHNTCQTVLGKEQIVYRRQDTVESGEYEIFVDHFRVCERLTRYRLRVLYDQDVVFEDNGFIQEESGPDVIKRKFTIP